MKQQLILFIFIMSATHHGATYGMRVPKKLSPSLSNCFRLKNNHLAQEEDIKRVMNTLVTLATSNHARYVMSELVYRIFFDKSNSQQLELLKKTGFTNQTNHIIDTELNIIKSAIDVDSITPGLSIIRSPLAGKYWLRPFGLHENDFHGDLYFEKDGHIESACSSITKRIDPIENAIFLQVNWFAESPGPLELERPLKLDDELEIDPIPYTYDGFWKQFGFDSHAEFLADFSKSRMPYEEWVKTKAHLIHEIQPHDLNYAKSYEEYVEMKADLINKGWLIE